MFTGLIEAVGTVEALKRRGEGGRIRVLARFADRLSPGESIAVDGVCLTAASLLREGFEADLSGETMRRTTIGAWQRGRQVNLERALAASARLGGHLVQGHVDGTAAVLRVGRSPDQVSLRVKTPPELAPLIALKGSVALDGVSLTVAALGRGWFEVALIPHTLDATNLRDRRAGDKVNLEADLFARYVARYLDATRRRR